MRNKFSVFLITITMIFTTMPLMAFATDESIEQMPTQQKGQFQTGEPMAQTEEGSGSDTAAPSIKEERSKAKGDFSAQEVASLYVGNVAVDGDNSDVFGDGTVSYKSTGDTSGKLTLNGATITNTNDAINSSSCIMSKLSDLTIELVGDNQVGNSDKSRIAVDVFGNLTITGTGQLTAIVPGAAIYSEGNISITGGTVNATTSSTSDDYSTIYLDGNLSITGGTINATSAYYIPIYSDGDINIEGGTINAEAIDSSAIYSSGDLSISDGTIDARSVWATTIYPHGKMTISGGKIKAESQGKYVVMYSNDDFTISGGSVNVKGSHCIKSAKDVIISGGTVDTTSTMDGHSIHSSGDMSISNGTIIAKSENACALNSDGKLTINGGIIKAEATGSASIIWCDGGNLTISGGTVTATGTNDIGSTADILISGGKVIADVSGTPAIWAEGETGNISITGGKVTAKTSATDKAAICTKGGDVRIDGSNVFASGGYGVSAANIVLSNSGRGNYKTRLEAKQIDGAKGYAMYAFGDNHKITIKDDLIIVTPKGGFVSNGTIVTKSDSRTPAEHVIIEPSENPIKKDSVSVKTGDVFTVGKNNYTVISVVNSTVKLNNAKNAKTVTIPASLKYNGKKYIVTGISAKAFKGKKTKTLIVKTKQLTKKSVKNSLKGSKIKTVKVKVGKKSVNKKYVKKYKKIFTKKNAGKKVKVK